jgi:hypothetical protein
MAKNRGLYPGSQQDNGLHFGVWRITICLSRPNGRVFTAHFFWAFVFAPWQNWLKRRNDRLHGFARDD